VGNQGQGSNSWVAVGWKLYLQTDIYNPSLGSIGFGAQMELVV